MLLWNVDRCSVSFLIADRSLAALLNKLLMDKEKTDAVSVTALPEFR